MGLGGYSPLSLRTKKDTGDSEPNAKREKKGAKKKEDGDPSAHVRPEGKKGLVWDAMAFHYRLEKLTHKIEKEFKAVEEMGRAALDLSQTDKNRKNLNQKFKQFILGVDAFIETLKIDDEVIFTGKFSKEFSLSPETAEVVKFEIPSFKTDDLQWRGIRIDSVVSARKADRALIFAMDRLKGVQEMLRQKAMFLQVKRRGLGMDQPNFDLVYEDGNVKKVVDQIEGLSAQLDPEVAEVEEVYSPRMVAIRNEQKQLANVLGRDSGLLVTKFG